MSKKLVATAISLIAIADIAIAAENRFRVLTNDDQHRSQERNVLAVQPFDQLLKGGA